MAGFVRNSNRVNQARNQTCVSSDIDEDGVHGGRMKPLSSLGVTIPENHAPSQALTAARIGSKASHKASSYSNGKRSAIFRVQRMHIRSKRCKKTSVRMNLKALGKSRFVAIEDHSSVLPIRIEETSDCRNKAEYLKSTKDRDMDSDSNLTCEGSDSSSKSHDNVYSSFRDTAISCFQGKKSLECIDKEATLSEGSLVQESSPLGGAAGLAPILHPSIAKCVKEKSPFSYTDPLKERMPNEFPLTQQGKIMDKRSCTDFTSMNVSIVKAEDQHGFVAEDTATCDVVPVATTTCKTTPLAKECHELLSISERMPSSFQITDVPCDDFRGQTCTEVLTVEPVLPFQASRKYRHVSGTKLSHATCAGSHSAESLGFIKGVKVDEKVLEKLLATNLKTTHAQSFMGRDLNASNSWLHETGSPHKLGDTDILKRMGELNPGIINRLRDKKQVHVALGAIIGAPTTTNASSPGRKNSSLKGGQQGENDDENQEFPCEYEGQPAKRRKSIDWTSRLTLVDSFGARDFATTLPLLDVNTHAAAHMMAEVMMQNAYSAESNSCKHVATDAKAYTNCSLQEVSERDANDVSMYKVESELATQQKENGMDWLCDQTIPYQRQPHVLEAANNDTANVALCWLELLRLDIKGRLSALKRSRRRIRSVIVSGRLEDKMSCGDDAYKKPIRWNMAACGGKGDNHIEETDNWRAFFLHMDGVLHSEGARLENWLKQIDEMQSHCQKKRTPSCLPVNHGMAYLDADRKG